MSALKQNDIEIQHFYGAKSVQSFKLKGQARSISIGSSRDADIRISGEGVAGIHALLCFDKDEWFLFDGGSQGGTWVDKNPVAHVRIDKETKVSIGDHQLRLVPKQFMRELFAKDQVDQTEEQLRDGSHQHIVIKDNGRLVKSFLRKANDEVRFTWSGTEVQLAPLNEKGLHVTHIDRFEVIQKRCHIPQMDRSSEKLGSMKGDNGARLMIMGAIFFFAAVLGVSVLIPKGPEGELQALQKDNKYAQIIYDAKIVQKAKKESQAARSKMAEKSPSQPAIAQTKEPAQVQKSVGKESKVVSKMKLQGLSSLLGKISKRASAKNVAIVGLGLTPDNPNTGSASAVKNVGSMEGLAKNAGSNNTVSAVGAVGTVGRGGGTKGGLGAIGGLSAGGAGSANVGILEEETEIEGGLDKEQIQKVIEGDLGAIRYCYERQLSAEPDLYGKVVVKFTITGEGGVVEQKVANTTLKSAQVEGCILRRMTRWNFPKPKGGTKVLVSYPFLFKSTN